MFKLTTSLLLLASAATAAQPNFVFILIDDMSWTGTSAEMIQGDALSKSDFYQTPNIEKLATHGLRFSNAYAPAALCTPSRAAILTGKTPAELHMTTPGGSRVQAYHKLASPKHIQELPETESTIAEVLKTEGYATAHFGKWHLGRQSPGLHGFDTHDGATENEAPKNADGPKDVYGVTERAIEFMEKQKEGPFYVQLSHYAVHTPVEGSDESINRFKKMQAGDRHSDATYAAMTYDLDQSIGRLLSAIARLNLAENTYIVIMSDNGGAATPRDSQNLPLNGGKGTFYEGGIRVPLIVYGPGIEANQFCGEPVTGCDLFPTFCELAGVKTTQLEGESLVPLFKNSSAHLDRSVNGLLFHYPHYGLGPRQKPQSAIISGNYKLLKDLETGRIQLFDLANDLSEKTDLSKRLPEKTAALEKLLKERLSETDAQMPSKNSAYDEDVTQTRERRR
jgi:arylsulfatase A-like enzyme